MERPSSKQPYRPSQECSSFTLEEQLECDATNEEVRRLTRALVKRCVRYSLFAGAPLSAEGYSRPTAAQRQGIRGRALRRRSSEALFPSAGQRNA